VFLSRSVNCHLNLDRTKDLIHGTIDESKPLEALIHVLESSIELVQIPDNDFAWSYWEDADQAKAEINQLISVVKSGKLPERVEVAVIFAPTGPLQEISLSSGWAEPFLKVAEKYDQIEQLLWSSS
jgi:hypothetical protein